ncbi:hypothetical protein SARC_02062 [Sphaeroforma arctica JP610]|uniref:TNFR-Cys domain-containing protein n=1 Tax=Sphaeroforma arctica JP610 TaxID=667725 RepID=A0A0L0GBX7_9EUKA|nr:hypothetical protein SARC_02062 [Sphaeroforma arctica JP610]KNC85758.1 hypothetical protein SARC_02062 [Sphaeroforma arctica JP610]|eukprot:XP_014159660.1 hypothetical protein SARC_02062 [Sphaeroforma arctica JP610]
MMKLLIVLCGLIAFLRSAEAGSSSSSSYYCRSPCGKAGYGSYVNSNCDYSSCSMSNNDQCSPKCETCGKCVARAMFNGVDHVKIDTSDCLGGVPLGWMAPTGPADFCRGFSPAEKNNTKVHAPATTGVWFKVDSGTPDSISVDKYSAKFTSNCGWNCDFSGRSWAYGLYQTRAERKGVCRQHIALDGVCQRSSCGDANCQNGYTSGQTASSVCFGTGCSETCCEPAPADKTCAEEKASNSCDSDYTYDSEQNTVLVTDVSKYNDFCCKPIPTCAQSRTDLSYECGEGRSFDTAASDELCETRDLYSSVCCKDAPTTPTCAEATDPEVYECEDGYVRNDLAAGVSVEFPIDFSQLCCKDGPCQDSNDKYILEVFKQCGAAIE